MWYNTFFILDIAEMGMVDEIFTFNYTARNN